MLFNLQERCSDLSITSTVYQESSNRWLENYSTGSKRQHARELNAVQLARNENQCSVIRSLTSCHSSECQRHERKGKKGHVETVKWHRDNREPLKAFYICQSCAEEHEIWSGLWQNSRTRSSGSVRKREPCELARTLRTVWFPLAPPLITHPSVSAVLWHLVWRGHGDTVHAVTLQNCLQPASRFRPSQGSDICFSSARPRFPGLPLAATQRERLRWKHAPDAS